MKFVKGAYVLDEREAKEYYEYLRQKAWDADDMDEYRALSKAADEAHSLLEKNGAFKNELSPDFNMGNFLHELEIEKGV